MLRLLHDEKIRRTAMNCGGRRRNEGCIGFIGKDGRERNPQSLSPQNQTCRTLAFRAAQRPSKAVVSALPAARPEAAETGFRPRRGAGARRAAA